MEEAALDFLPRSSSPSSTLLSATITVLTLLLSLPPQCRRNLSSTSWYFTLTISFSYSDSDSELIFVFVIKQVDAFTDTPFKGNPAAVCLLEEEKDDKWLQDLAAEFNISETSYLVRINEEEETDGSLKPPKFGLRWFTPVTEVFLLPFRFNVDCFEQLL